MAARQVCPACGKKVATRPHENGNQVYLRKHTRPDGDPCGKTNAPRMFPVACDRKGQTLATGDAIIFKPRRGKPMDGVITSPYDRDGEVEAKIANDPFSVLVKLSQVERKERPVKSEARDLKQRAIILEIPGYEHMKLHELRAAVEEAENPKPAPTRPDPSTTERVERKKKAPDPGQVEGEKEITEAVARRVKKTATKKKVKSGTPSSAIAMKRNARKASAAKKRAPAKKAAVVKKVAKKPSRQPHKANPGRPAVKAKSERRAAATEMNPFRKGCAAWHITEELLRGGVRREMVARLKKKVRINPWSKSRRQLDYEKEMDKRIVMTAAELQREYGFHIERMGEGIRSRIKAYPPGVNPLGRKASKKSAKKASTSKKASAKRSPRKVVAKKSKKVGSSKKTTSGRRR